MVTLFSFLGTSDYVPVRYQLGTRVSSRPCRFVQSALLELLEGGEDGPVDQIVVAVTDEASTIHRAALETEMGREISFVRIAEIKGESDVWNLFSTVVRALPTQGSVAFDCTHGFRSLPLIGSMCVEFLRTASRVRDAGTYYGAFEVLGRADDVRARAEDQRGVAPILDLRTLNELVAWSHAVDAWRSTGRTAGLLRRISPVQAQLGRERRVSRALNDLVTTLRATGDAIAVMNTLEVPRLGRAAAEKVEVAQDSLPDEPSLAPLHPLLGHLHDELQGLARGGLRGQVDLVSWFLERDRLLEAMALVREVAIDAIIEALPTPPEEIDSKRRGTPEYREKLADYVADLVGKRFLDEDEKGKKTARNRAPEEMSDAPAARFLLGQLAPLQHAAELAAIAASAKVARNNLAHCWRGRDDGGRRGKDKATSDVQLLVERLRTVIGDATFANVSNHPLAEWKPPQLEAARALAPDLVDVDFPDVPPDADDEALDALAKATAAQVPRSTTHALVMGEMTLTFRLVSILEARGISCLATTTSRSATVDDDGVKTSRFEFVRFRPYRSGGKPDDET